MRITFTFQDGEIKSYPIKQSTFVIGRAQSCDILVTGTEFSREHCRVDIVGKSIYLTDLKSSNGVYIDNKQISPGVKTKYSTTQQLMMGDSYVVFDLSSEELTRSMVNLRPLLQNENQTGITKIRVKEKQVREIKRESFQSTVLTLLAWVILLSGTYFLATAALS